MTTIQERIERGGAIVEKRMAEEAQRAQEYDDRVSAIWSMAIEDALEFLPEDVREFVVGRNQSHGQLPNPMQYPLILKLKIPSLAPITVSFQLKYVGKEGYLGSEYIVSGLGRPAYRVGRYFPGVLGDMEERTVDIKYDDAYEDLDLALYEASLEEENLDAVRNNVVELNAQLARERMRKAEIKAAREEMKRSPEAAIADTLVKLLNMVRDYTEPEPY